MLARSERLPRGFLIKPQGKRVSFGFGTATYLSLVPARVAVVAPKKVFKTAPARNRVRRRVYTIVRTLLRTGSLKKSIIIFPNAQARTAPFEELKKELARIVSAAS